MGPLTCDETKLFSRDTYLNGLPKGYYRCSRHFSAINQGTLITLISEHHLITFELNGTVPRRHAGTIIRYANGHLTFLSLADNKGFLREGVCHISI